MCLSTASFGLVCALQRQSRCVGATWISASGKRRSPNHATWALRLHQKLEGAVEAFVYCPTVVELLAFLKPLHASEDDYVFRDALGKPFDAAQWRKRHWNQALRVKEIRPRKFYAIRHTYISIALSQRQDQMVGRAMWDLGRDD